jgi:alkylated DNA repair dioxygenase AlkB
VTVAFQGSLLELGADPRPGPLADRISRVDLGRGAWIDVAPTWITGADVLFERLVSAVPWHAERRQMYDNIVDVPRLLKFYDEQEPLPDIALVEAKQALDEYYAAELGERFATAGLCLYRDGRDSVAWHGDRIGRSSTEDTIVAIVSVGSPRSLMLRPRRVDSEPAGGSPMRYELGHGDLLVMGGSCQRTWEHAIPKTARPVGPRISIQFRTRGVR